MTENLMIALAVIILSRVDFEPDLNCNIIHHGETGGFKSSELEGL